MQKAFIGRRRFICWLNVFILFGVLLQGCGHSVKNINSPGTVIICFGDSITFGQGIPQDESFPSILSHFIGEEVINAGHSGDTTAEALERLKKDVLQRDPYLVIVELGGNDFLRRIDVAVTFKNMEEIVKRIVESGAIAAVCDIDNDLILSSYRSGFEKICKKYGAIFIPGVLRGILDNSRLTVDSIHPNEKGHRIIAERIYKGLSRYGIFERRK